MPFVSSIRGAYGIQGSVYDRYPFASNTFSTSSSGGTITTAGGYRIHTFTTVGSATLSLVQGLIAENGTRSPSGTLNTGVWSGQVEYLVIGGGAGGEGGIAGGGGAGGYRTGSLTVSAGSLPVIVGAGGSSGAGPYSAPIGQNGNDSVFSSITSFGGSTARGYPGFNTARANAGSGGGGAYQAAQPFAGGGGGGAGGIGGSASNPIAQFPGNPGTPGQGNPGGLGGTGAAGSGGPGLSSSITGTAVTRGGGGGGGTYPQGPAPAAGGAAGPGGGGRGGTTAHLNATPGEANTGGGGGTGAHSSPLGGPAEVGGSGGPGIVVVRYLI